MTYSAVLFGADFVARSLQTAAGMLVARASSAPKNPRRLRHRTCASLHLAASVLARFPFVEESKEPRLYGQIKYFFLKLLWILGSNFVLSHEDRARTANVEL